MVMLYDHPLSPYAQKVKIALREKSVGFETRMTDIVNGGTADFVATSPRGEVPSLVNGSVVISDSTIICEYIEDQWPSPALRPPLPAARARVRLIEDMCDSSYDPPAWGMMEVAVFKRVEGPLAETLAKVARQDVDGINDWLTGQLGEHQWFNGTSFGWGDMAVAPFVYFSSVVGLPPAPGPLADWYARVARRPSVAATFAEGDAVLGLIADVPAMMKSPSFRREYRDHRLEWMIRSGGIDLVTDGLKHNNIRFSPPVRR